MSELSPQNYLLLPQLPVQHRHPCSDLPHRALPRVLRGQRHHQHHAGQRGQLLQHAEAQRLHGRRVFTAAGRRSEGLPRQRGDEALAAGDVHHLPRPHLRLHHRQFCVMVTEDFSCGYLTVSYSIPLCVINSLGS